MSANCSLPKQWAYLLFSSLEIPHIWWHINNTTIKIQPYFRLMKESLVGGEGCAIRKFKAVPLIKSHKIPNICSTLTSHSQCCDKLVAGLARVLAHKQKKVFQHRLFLPTYSSNTPKLKLSRRHHLPSQQSGPHTPFSSHSHPGAIWQEEGAYLV